MPKSTLDLQSIARAGGGISIDATSKSTLDLQSIARNAQESGATLIIRNADCKSTLDLQSIARSAPGKVIFEL